MDFTKNEILVWVNWQLVVLCLNNGLFFSKLLGLIGPYLVPLFEHFICESNNLIKHMQCGFIISFIFRVRPEKNCVILHRFVSLSRATYMSTI